jgi:Domain of unknown function (DUF397)
MESSDLSWRKATRSAAQGGCVELAYGPDGRATGMVRDSKNRQAGHLAVTPEVLGAFLGAVKRGELDLQ